MEGGIGEDIVVIRAAHNNLIHHLVVTVQMLFLSWSSHVAAVSPLAGGILTVKCRLVLEDAIWVEICSKVSRRSVTVE